MNRDIMETEGVLALKRLMDVATQDSGQCRRVAAFLLGLYNGQRFPFDLTELRGLDGALFADCMKVLQMDARLTRQEVHTYFPDGGKRFEQLAADWSIEDEEKVRAAARRTKKSKRADAPPPDGGEFQAKLLTCGEAPGYRDISLLMRIGDAHGPRIRVDLNAKDSEDVMQSIAAIHARAWSGGHDRRPLDASAEEQRPGWLDRTPAQWTGA